MKVSDNEETKRIFASDIIDFEYLIALTGRKESFKDKYCEAENCIFKNKKYPDDKWIVCESEKHISKNNKTEQSLHHIWEGLTDYDLEILLTPEEEPYICLRCRGETFDPKDGVFYPK